MSAAVISKRAIEPQDNVWDFLVAGNPASVGLTAGIGSFARQVDSTVPGDVFAKTGANATDWVKISHATSGPAIPLSDISGELSDRVFGPTALAIGSTDRRVASGAFTYQIGASAAGVNTYKSKAAITAGTVLAAGTVPADTWALYLFSIPANGTIACTPAAANFSTGYATEAAAILAKPATPASSAPMGYVTLKTASAQPFVGDTDSLHGGATGNVASQTNYYDAGLAFA